MKVNGPLTVEKRFKQYYSSDTGAPSFRLDWHEVIREGVTIATVHNNGGREVDDARLFATAPGMLDALVKIAADPLAISQADLEALIAKATRTEPDADLPPNNES